MERLGWRDDGVGDGGVGDGGQMVIPTRSVDGAAAILYGRCHPGTGNGGGILSRLGPTTENCWSEDLRWYFHALCHVPVATRCSL